MILIEKGGIYRAARAKSGSSNRGDWELVAVADENNSKRTQTIFIATPTGIREGQMFKVLEIVSFKNGWKKDQNGEWKPEASITAEIEPIASEIDVNDIDPWDDIPDLPL